MQGLAPQLKANQCEKRIKILRTQGEYTYNEVLIYRLLQSSKNRTKDIVRSWLIEKKRGNFFFMAIDFVIIILLLIIILAILIFILRFRLRYIFTYSCQNKSERKIERLHKEENNFIFVARN